MKYIVIICFLFFKAYSQNPYKLNSLPGASACIFIDFDGHTVTDFFWRPFNKDSVIFCDSSRLKDSQIVKIFNHVSEDFRPFNINITTDSTSYFSASLFKRTRVIVTPTYRWYGTSGGVAYVESFRWGLEIPCFVFSGILLNDEKYIAEAVSHEAGHTLGLYHQAVYNDTCKFIDEYDSGKGSGEIGWAPIMGNSYFRNMTLWSIGKNSFGCDRIQDDLAIISSKENGFGYRNDDYPNTFDSSIAIQFTDNKFNIDGIINRTEDIDLFNFNMPYYGRFTLNAKPYSVVFYGISVNSNIDLKTDIFDNNKSIIGSYNKPLSVLAAADTNLNAGKYFISISNNRNINTSNYGMLGSYNLSGSIIPYAALPVYNINIKGEPKENGNYIYWTFNTDEAIAAINIQYSKDNLNWEDIIVEDIDNQYYMHYDINDVVFYRLIIKTERGPIYSSRTIVINRKQNERLYKYIFMYNKLLIHIRSNADWRLIDISGKEIKKGKLSIGTNTIDFGQASGIYLLQLYIDGKYFTEKIAL